MTTYSQIDGEVSGDSEKPYTMLNAVWLSSNLRLFAYAARRTLSSGQLYINVFCEIVLENRKLLDFGLRHV